MNIMLKFGWSCVVIIQKYLLAIQLIQNVSIATFALDICLPEKCILTDLAVLQALSLSIYLIMNSRVFTLQDLTLYVRLLQVSFHFQNMQILLLLPYFVV